MLANTGLTALGWIFMLVSTVSVTVLVIWCFRRVLGAPPDGGPHGPVGLGP